MNYDIFTIKDIKSNCFHRPFFAQNKIQAQRDFARIANDKESPIGNYPEDFQLFSLGVFHDSDGSFEIWDQPIFLNNATQFVKEPDFEQMSLVEMFKDFNEKRRKERSKNDEKN